MPSMNHALRDYRTFFFDCDGVLLDSNRVKTEAFYNVALEYAGEKEALVFSEYHMAHGGISRQEKFKHFFLNILQNEHLDKIIYEDALSRYSQQVSIGLLGCDIAPGVLTFLRGIPESSKRFVVSGGAENEVRQTLEIKGLSGFFDAIYGSPRDKKDLVKVASREHQWEHPALFIGDARYDHVVSKFYDMDFLFVAGLSEFPDWKSYVNVFDLSVAQSLGSMFDGIIGE